MLERDLQKKCVTMARAGGWWVRKFVSQGRRSAPDYIFIRDGFVWFCEFKRPGQKPTELQLKEHKEMVSYGAEVVVCDDIDEFSKLLACWDAP